MVRLSAALGRQEAEARRQRRQQDQRQRFELAKSHSGFLNSSSVASGSTATASTSSSTTTTIGQQQQQQQEEGESNNHNNQEMQRPEGTTGVPVTFEEDPARRRQRMESVTKTWNSMMQLDRQDNRSNRDSATTTSTPKQQQRQRQQQQESSLESNSSSQLVDAEMKLMAPSNDSLPERRRGGRKNGTDHQRRRDTTGVQQQSPQNKHDPHSPSPFNHDNDNDDDDDDESVTSLDESRLSSSRDRRSFLLGSRQAVDTMQPQQHQQPHQRNHLRLPCLRLNQHWLLFHCQAPRLRINRAGVECAMMLTCVPLIYILQPSSCSHVNV